MCHEPTYAPQQTMMLFDHFVGATEFQLDYFLQADDAVVGLRPRGSALYMC
jgi:hypothetical protein